MLLLARQEVLLPAMRKIEETLVAMAHDLAEVPMLSRTHGQAATPTTVGKELANVVARLRTQLAQISASPIRGCGGSYRRGEWRLWGLATQRPLQA